jgi:hypothetical protein
MNDIKVRSLLLARRRNSALSDIALENEMLFFAPDAARRRSSIQHRNGDFSSHRTHLSECRL